MNVRERDVDVGGIRVHIRDAGEGRPVLLLNGIGAHGAMWEPLEQALGGLRLIEFDAPGSGRSGTPLYPVSIPALAWLAGRVLDEVKVSAANVIGYSMGGMVAQQMAAAAPRRVDRLVLVATSCGWGGVPGQPAALLNLATPLRYRSKTFHALTLGSMTGGRSRSDRTWVERHGELRRRHPPSTRGYLGQLLSASLWCGLPLLARIRNPTLVVSGDDDPLVPIANAMLLASRLPLARLVVAPDEGHLLLMDPRSAVLEPIREFLAAEPLEAARVWRASRVVTLADADAAIAETRHQMQPWGVLSSVIRAAWPAHADCPLSPRR
jgi:pimeloyl-ACP methyl ester carboxylesterase